MALSTQPSSGGPTFIPQDLADADAGAVPKSGYGFVVTGAGDTVQDQADTCNNAADSHTEFFASAAPVTPGTTGSRYFATDHSGMIRQSANAEIELATWELQKQEDAQSVPVEEGES